jgi:hypothetical protein
MALPNFSLDRSRWTQWRHEKNISSGQNSDVSGYFLVTSHGSREDFDLRHGSMRKPNSVLQLSIMAHLESIRHCATLEMTNPAKGFWADRFFFIT